MTHGHSGHAIGCRCDICREGHRVYTASWRAANRERYRAVHRAWQRRNPERRTRYRRRARAAMT